MNYHYYMFHKPFGFVIFLKRISIGNIVLDPELKPGEFKEILKEEL